MNKTKTKYFEILFLKTMIIKINNKVTFFSLSIYTNKIVRIIKKHLLLSVLNHLQIKLVHVLKKKINKLI